LSKCRDRTGRDLIFLHGFASSANSTKARYLAGRLAELPGVRFLVPDFNPTPKDFEFLTVTGMVNRLRQYRIDHDVKAGDLIASSLGGLVALHYAHRFGGVGRLLLFAPVLSYGSLVFPEDMLGQWEREGTIEFSHYGFPGKVLLCYDFHLDGLHYAGQIPPPVPVLILHGKDDEVMPIKNSRNYASQYPEMVKLVELDSDHGLLDRMDEIWEHVSSLISDY
jgi:pimeloyl-ACP methyl ester carboxylesterase